MTKGKKQEKAPKSCQECKNWAAVKDKLRVGGILGTVIKNMETKIQADEYKPSLADFLKLVQMEKELGEDGPEEIIVTWVEPEKSSSET